MARARNIKPAFFRNEFVVSLPFQTRILFIGLWTLADKEGRLEDRPMKIKLELFPADDVDVSLELSRLSEAGLVKQYRAEGINCIQILKFKKHQNPHHREPDSELPPMPEGEPQDTENKGASESLGKAPEIKGKPESSRADSPSLIPDSPIPDSLQGNSSPPHGDSQTVGDPQGVRDFPLKDGSEFHADEDYIAELRAAYPQISVEYELRRARLWLISNAGKRKTRAGMKKFLTAWMGRQKPPAEVHQIRQRHSGFSERDYSEGLIEGVDDHAANF